MKIFAKIRQRLVLDPRDDFLQGFFQGRGALNPQDLLRRDGDFELGISMDLSKTNRGH